MADATNTTIPPEEWRPIAGWEGLYEVSNRGQVRRILPSGGDARYRQLRGAKTFSQRRYKPYCCIRVGLTRNNQTKLVAIHRLVCAAFHGPQPSPRHQVAHWDGDSLNNAASNLRWATPAENMADNLRLGVLQLGGRHKGSRLTEDDVREIKRLLEAKEATGLAISQRYRVSAKTVSSIRRGQTWRWLA